MGLECYMQGVIAASGDILKPGLIYVKVKKKR
jgi:hypothetical protein